MQQHVCVCLEGRKVNYLDNQPAWALGRLLLDVTTEYLPLSLDHPFCIDTSLIHLDCAGIFKACTWKSIEALGI